MKKFVKLLTASAAVLSLAACGSSTTSTTSSDSSSTAAAETETLTVIATANPHAIILEEAKKILASDYNIDLQITVTDNYYVPNEAVSNGEADANYFQHVPFFDGEVADKGYNISNVAGIHIEPFGFYSKSISDISELPDGAEIIISNSVADNGRILSILAKEGLLKLDSTVDVVSATLNDITENPKGLKFTEVAPETLTAVYEQGEGDLVAINGNYAIQAGLKPSEDAVLLEQADSTNPYVNIVACQAGHEDDAKIQALVEVLKSDAIKSFIEETWSDGSVIPAE